MVINCAAIGLLMCSLCGVAAAEIYKTTDANGTVVYTDHVDPASAQPAVVWQDPRYPPHEMHVCWTNCFTLLYDGRMFHRKDGTDETWTVTTFTADSVVLHRHSVPADWNGFSDDVTYAGRVFNDRLVGVTLNGKPMSGIDASWGIALNTLPGSNTERDARLAPGAPDPGQGAAATDVAVSAAVPPPPLPDEPQPVIPQDGYLWTPGYWYWGGTAYVWVPGAWLQPPTFGLLWTPAYWSFADARYVFHPGYWGPHVGYYGGINYGFGYFGSGYAGGHWDDHSFAYNRSVNHLNPSVVRVTYAEAVSGRAARNRVSFNGGPGGTPAVATDQEKLFAAAALSRTAPSSVWAATPVRAATSVRAATTVRAATPVQHVNAGGSKPPVVRLSVQSVARTTVETDPQERPSRSAAPRSSAVPAPRVNRPTAATRVPHQP